MSRFATPKSEDARLEAATDPSQYGDIDENDPQAMARFVRRMGEEMGEDLGDDLGEAMEAASGDEGGMLEGDAGTEDGGLASFSEAPGGDGAGDEG